MEQVLQQQFHIYGKQNLYEEGLTAKKPVTYAFHWN